MLCPVRGPVTRSRMVKKAFSGNKKKSGSLGESPPKRIKLMPQKQTKESASLKMVKVDTSEETFPRGGQQTLTPLEKSVIRTQAKQDALFTEEPIETTKTTGKLPRGLKAKKSEPKPMKRIDILSKKTVVPGMLLLGAVLEVNKLHAVFSLPFNLRGVVAISDVSDHVTKLVRAEAQGSDDMPADSDIPTMERLFSVGQLLPCYVQAIKGSLVNLSVNPYLVNSHLTAKDLKPNLLLLGFVKSVEDHGYIVDFGISGKSGFLLKKNAAEFVKVCRRGKSLCAGQVLQCVVLSATDTKAIPVSVNPSQVTTAILSQDLLVGVGSLLPGLLVKTTVKQVAPNGLLVGFLDGFEGVVSCQHLSAPSSQSIDKYQVGKKVRARLLWVNISTKTAGLTFQERLLGGTAYDFQGVEIGDKFEAAKVIHVDHSSALYLEIGAGVVGYAPSWMVTDEELGKEGVAVKHRKQYRVGTLHEARVIQFNSMDGVAIVSLQDAVLDKRYMKYSDIQVGDYVEGEVERVADFGMTVSITAGIHGLCPRIHVSDLQTVVANPGKRYRSGAKVKCRVLNVTPAKRQLLLSCKKSLIRLGGPEREGGGGEENEEEENMGGRSRILCDYASAIPGECYTGVITSVYSYGCIVHFFDKVRGLVHRDELSSSRVISNPATEFWEGQPVECRVLACSPATEKLSLSLRLDAEETRVTYDESMTPQSRVAESAATAMGGEFGVVAAADAETRGPKAGGDVMPVQDSNPIGSSQKSSSSNVYVGDIIPTLVVSVTPCLLKVKYHLWKGRVHCTLAKDEEERVTVTSDLPSKELTELRRNVFSHLHRGDEVTCRVVKIRQTQIMNQASKKGATISTLELTTKPSLLDPEVAVDPGALLKKKWKNGDSLSAVVSKVSPSGLHVHLSPQISGFVPLLSVSKDIKVLKNLKKYYAEGQLVQCVVVDSTKRLLELSMIGSVILKDGHVSMGHVVKEVPGSHLVVGVPGGRGHLDITDTTDDYQPNPFQTALRGGKFIRCCVVKKEDSKIDLSLRESRMAAHGNEEISGKVKDPEINGLEDVVEGTVVRGYIKAITDVGVFVRLGRGIDGRVQITHLRDGFKKDFKKLYAVGQLVRTKVLKVHQGTGKVDLSLRLSLVDPEAAKRKSDKRKRKRETEKEELGSDGENKQEIEEHGSSDNAEPSSDVDMETSEDEDVPDMRESDEEGVLHCTTKPTLSLAGGFRWEMEGEGGGNKRSFGGDEKRDTSGSSSEEEEEEEMEVETSTKKTRRQKKAAKKLEEIQLYRKERLLLDTEKEPESAEDFDRLLVSSPNQSSLWVQYMAFYLNTAEVDKARGIAQRALRTITFTEESEKLNVWVGWLNMENLYGTAETLAGVFESALEKCEPLHVYKKLATIYETSGKIDQASKLYHTMTKKFGSNQWVWSRYMTFLMQQMKYDQARSVLQRALKMLKGKQDHITTISKMSTLEYKYGDTERGCTMFESLVSTYPRKVDVWSVYIDAVIKTKDYQRVRELFERATNLKLSAQKMKSIYKKYLSFESEHGSQAMVEVVLEKARAFANSYQAGMEVE